MIQLLIAFAFGYAGAFATVAGWVIYQSILIDRDQNREAYNDARGVSACGRPRDPRQVL